METARADVARLLAEEQEAEPPEKEQPMEPDKPAKQAEEMDEKAIWDTLFSFIGNSYGTAGIMGNLYAESGLKANNLQNTGSKALALTDEEYTAAVDNGYYGNFSDDRYGYGLAQWTYPSRKQALLAFARQQGKSIGNCAMQLEFLKNEMGKELLLTLKAAGSVQEASDAVLLQYERPANQSQEALDKRAAYSQQFFQKYGASVYFRVRKTWENKASQMGAFHVLQYAKQCADKNPGYAVFNESGIQIYPSENA